MKKLFIYLFLLLCVTNIYAQEADKTENNTVINIEIQSPVFGLQNSMWSSTWYDYYNQKAVSKKELIDIISTNPESAKLVKASKVADIFTWSWLTIGLSSSIASFFIQDPKTQKVFQGIGNAFILTFFIPITISDTSLDNAVNKYNQKVLGIDKIKNGEF